MGRDRVDMGEGGRGEEGRGRVVKRIWSLDFHSVFFFFFVHVPVCLCLSHCFVCLSVCLPVCLSTYLSIYLCIYLFACLYICLCLSVYMRLCLSVSFCLSVYICLCLSVYIRLCLSVVCLYIYASQFDDQFHRDPPVPRSCQGSDVRKPRGMTYHESGNVTVPLKGAKSRALRQRKCEGARAAQGKDVGCMFSLLCFFYFILFYFVLFYSLLFLFFACVLLWLSRRSDVCNFVRLLVEFFSAVFLLLFFYELVVARLGFLSLIGLVLLLIVLCLLMLSSSLLFVGA